MMNTSKAAEFLEQLAADRPDLAEKCGELGNLYSRKLWHQLTIKLEEYFQEPDINSGDIPLRIYDNFISDFWHRINLLKYSQFAVHVSKFYGDSTKCINLLEDAVKKLEELKQPSSAEPILYLRMNIAQHQLQLGNVQECKTLIEQGKEELEAMNDVDPVVSAAVYYVGSLFHKFKKNYADFYRSSLMYLAYVSSESLAPDFKLSLAVDVSLAALLGEHLYNFGELLLHPLVTVLDGTTFQWLHEMLDCFNRGDLHEYEVLCSKYANTLNSQPALVESEKKLREKITIMSVMELISSMPAEDRRISLQTIADRTKLSTDGVEFLLMKVLSLHLIEGIIDEVDSYVQVSWVQPRVLTKPQIQGLKDRLDGWISKVNSISLTLEQETVGVVDLVA